MEKDNNDIAQISFYLAKEKRVFETVIDPEAGLDKRRAFRTHDFEVEGASCRFIYFETPTAKSNPPWLDFINEQIEDGSKIIFKSLSASANGILLVRIEDRVLIATFGRSASSCLDGHAFEADFGIKTAMNMCGNEEIRQTKSQSTSITTTHIDRQVSKPSDAFVFGLSEAEDLRYISAHMKGDKNMTLQGRDSLTLKVSGKEKLSWKKLVAQCAVLLEQYESKEYVKLFPNYRNFRSANEEEKSVLDGILIEALRRKDFTKIQMSIPEFIPDDEFSYSYTNNASRDNKIYAYIDVSQLSEHLDLPKVTIDKIHAKKIFAYSAVEDRVLEYKKWSLYNCIGFEHELEGKYFILSDGRWLEVDAEFYDAIMDFIKNRLHVEPCEDIYRNIDISDDVAKKNKESIFNETVVRIRPSCVLFDRAKLRIGGGSKNKEFCDILDLDDDGVRIINAKQYKDVASINYLFSQAKFYCEAFLHDDVFLTEIREHIEAGPCAERDKYLAYIKPKIEEIIGQDYRVCLWLLYDKADQEPSKMDIPLIAQYELKLMHDHLKRVCKFRDIVLRFVPVRIKQYTTARPPKAAA